MNIPSAVAFPGRSLYAPGQPPAQTPPAQAPPAQDPPGLIRRGIEGLAGLAVGAGSAAFHAPLGVVKGISEGLASQKNQGGTGWYNLGFFAESVGLGAALGACSGGLAGAAIGAGVGLVGGAVLRYAADRAGADEKWVDAVEKAVDRAVADNTDGTRMKIMVQNATEGAIVGFGTGVREGWNIGREAGKGLVGGVLDVAEGIYEGIKEVIFGA
ncbi:MAG TPA: hypothetical protein VNO81_14950 [Candidatus Nitrosotenuis sp.]|jgi:hypothetical protein|nr:hypothetical protein [Candidatus Nitrosotenuis sp.]